MEPMMEPMMERQPQMQSRMQPQGKPAQGNPGDDKAKAVMQRLGMAAMKIIYDKATSEGLVEMMRAGAQEPAQAVAQAAQVVFSKMQESVRGIDPKLVYAVAPGVVVWLLELAEASKAFKTTPQIMQQAIQLVKEQGMGPQEQQAPQPAPQPPGLIGAQMQPMEA